jgi:putative hemolysin
MEPCSSMQSVSSPAIFFVIALTSRALFSFLETSITALRLFKLKELAASTNKYEHFFQALEKTPHRVLITILIASSLAEVTAASLGTHIIETFLGQQGITGGLAFSMGIGFATLIILIFGEILPKNIAKTHGERLFTSTLWITNIIFYLLYPIVTILLKLTDFIVYQLGGTRLSGGVDWVSSEKEIQFLINYINEKGLMEQEKSAMLKNIFDLGLTPVKDIMVPATDIVSVNVTATIRDTLEIFGKRHFTRLPVYNGQQDNIIGMVHLKDVFGYISRNEDKPLKDIVRPIMFIPESVKINQLLREFRQQHMHIAIVLNEHGSITGLITLEDILEEIVGEISDEHDPATEKIIPLKQGGWLVDASTPLQGLASHLGITFESEDSITLAGFLTEQLQHLPKKGERILYKNHYFQVQKASDKRVLEVLIFTKKSDDDNGPGEL